ncbi:DUF1194 domain-containing protein [Beggiatoa alba]|nr:DUF1194 domain-containing protein [Beggiatoa alba]
MKKSLRKFTIAALALIVPAFMAGNAQAIPVDLELALVIDTSGSVSSTEFALQINGYAAAFNNVDVQNAIQTLGDAGTGGIAVGVYFFDTLASPQINWTQLVSAADAADFATALAALTDPTDGWTNIARGMDLGIAGILGNNFEGSRLVMDVSGDGKQNVNFAGVPSTVSTECSPSKINTSLCYGLVETERDQAAAVGITINGLAIIDDFTDLAMYYGDYVATADGFVFNATFNTFASAVEQKIFREITTQVTQVPEPATLLLMGIGLLGMAMRQRKAA